MIFEWTPGTKGLIKVTREAVYALYVLANFQCYGNVKTRNSLGLSQDLSIKSASLTKSNPDIDYKIKILLIILFS